jgi:diguanylate cyclase (GGDEF)-like protein
VSGTSPASPEPARPTDAAASARLRGLLEVTRLVRHEAEPLDLLPEIARAISESLHFSTCVISLYRPEWDDFKVSAVHGSPQAREVLLGVERSWDEWEPLFDPEFSRDGAYFLPFESFDWSRDKTQSYVPPLQPLDVENAWHPEDALFVPLRHSDGHTLGIVSLDEPVSGLRPTDDEYEVLVAFAQLAAQVLEGAQKSQSAARHRAALEQLLQVSSRLSEPQSIDAILQSLCDAIQAALGFQKVSVDLAEDQTRRLRPKAAAGWEVTDDALSSIRTVDEISPLLDPGFELEGCYLLPPDEATRRLSPRSGGATYSSVMNGRGPRAWNHHWLLVPLYDREGSVMGLIWADEPEDRLIPSRDKLQALRVFANQATAAIDSAGQFEELRFLADHDPLTRLGNRRAFMRQLQREAGRSVRYGQPFSLVLCDLDGFKALNDRLGHLAGDAALQHFGAILDGVLRRSDGAFRIGGDEFALVLVQAGAIEAEEVVERVRRLLHAAEDQHALGSSFGVAVFDPAASPAPDGIFRQADEAMYAAKRAGREVGVATPVQPVIPG